MRNIIWRVLSVAFGVRLFLPIFAFSFNQNYQIFHAADTVSYIEPAIQLLAHGRFSYNNGTPNLERTPGYPLFLIPGILLGNTELVTIALQIILSCLTVYLVYKIALLLYKRAKVAAICGLLYALEPLSVLYTSKILTETLFTTLFTISLYYFLKYLDIRKLEPLIISGIALAASAYVRPVSYYLALVLTGFVIIWTLMKLQHNKILVVHACVFFMVSMGLTSCWHIRNIVVAGYPEFCAATAVNIYYYNAPAVLAAKNKTTFDEVQAQMRSQDKKTYCLLNPDRTKCNQSEVFKSMKKEGLKILAENRLIFAMTQIKGMMRVIFGPASSDYARLFGQSDDKVGIAGGAFYDNILETVKNLFRKEALLFWVYLTLGTILAIYLLSATVGFIYVYNLKKISAIALLMISVYFITVSAGAMGQGRYRHPVMPIICILSGYGLSGIFNRLRKKDSENNRVLDREPTSTSA